LLQLPQKNKKAILMKSLIIVESPAKAKTIKNFVDKSYNVIASKGHIRDLPKTSFGIKIEDDKFTPEYRISSDHSAIVKEIKELNIRISDIDINDGKIVAKGLNGNISQVNGEVLLENNSKALIKGQNNGYEITYNKDNFTSKTLFAINKISSLIEYSKNDLLEGRIVKLASELILENNNFKNLNHTVLTDEEKTLLTQKIENLRNNNYQQIMSKYEEDNKNIETLIDNVYVQKNKLDKLQRDLLSLGTIITFEQSAAADENSSLSSEQNGSSAINIQNKPDSINNSDSNNTNNSTEKQNSNQNTNKINIGNR